MSKKVLVIAEGANDKKIIGRIFSAYEKNIEVFTFEMDVYQLFAIYDKQGVRRHLKIVQIRRQLLVLEAF